MAEKTYTGTELKYKVVITAGGFSMMDDDFNIKVVCGSKSKVYEKADLLLDENDNWYLPIDTTEFKKGDLWAIITLYVPDDDFPDGLRTEIVKKKLDTLWDVRK